MSLDELLPNGNILSVADFGAIIRSHRVKQGITQADLAALSGVGTRFISDLENGKPTIALGKALQVALGLGLEIQVARRGWIRKGSRE
jgi:y4mF family transcriptional regulator